jgi:hypothetical protein
MSNMHDAKVINEYRQRQESRAKEKLEKMGVEIDIAHYTGDSSFPTEYTFSYGKIYAMGPTFDLALLDLVGRLLKKIDEVEA